MVGYVQQGTSPQATELNALSAELDAVLGMLFSWKSPLIYGWNIQPGIGNDELFGKRFHFGNPAVRRILSGVSDEYDHDSFTTAAAALVPDYLDEPRHLAISENNDPWPLDDSLGCHTTEIDTGSGPATYWLARKQPLTGVLLARERYRRLDVAEIVVEGWDHETPFIWAPPWDKYHFLRFHNLDPRPLAVELPGESAPTVIPAFGVQAVRRSYPRGGWLPNPLRYLWPAITGDQLIFDGVRCNNVASLLCFHRWLSSSQLTTVGAAVSGLVFDPRRVWDGRRMLPREWSTTCRIGELLYHLGEVLTIQAADVEPQAARVTVPDWATLESAGGVGGVRAVCADHELTLEAVEGTVAPVDAIGITSNILPAVPATLPVTQTASVSGPAAPGIHENTETLWARYPHPETSEWVEVETDEPRGVVSSWSPAGGRVWVTTLDQQGTLATDGSPGVEVTTRPAVEWASDGWRIVGHGLATLPAHAGYALPVQSVRVADFTGDQVTVPFGGNIVNGREHGQDPLMSAQWSREVSIYAGETDIFGQVYHYGHPDAGDFEGEDQGIDWEPRRIPAEISQVRRDELAPVEVGTRNLPVHPLHDTADRLLAGYQTPGWYLDNRESLQSLTLHERQRLVRVKVKGGHYNRIAQRLNGVSHVIPKTLEDVLWYSGIADGAWPLSSTYPQRPVGFWGAVLPSGSRAASLGIPIRTTGLSMSPTIETQVDDPEESPWPAYVETEFPTWLHVNDVKAWAEEHGLNLYVCRLATPQLSPDDWDGPHEEFTGLSYFRHRYLKSHFTGSTTGWRAFSGRSAWVGHMPAGVQTGASPTETFGPVDQALRFQPEEYAPGLAWEVERVAEWDAESVPEGWEMADDERVLIYPRTHLGYTEEPVSIGFTPFDAVPKVGSPLFVPISAFTSPIGAAEVAELISDEIEDGREGFCLSLCTRFVFRRIAS